eukprot:3681285-Pyramimonas_sp.AAC.1
MLASWAPLGGALGALLGTSWEPLGQSWDHLGRLGALLGRLGGLLYRLGGLCMKDCGFESAKSAHSHECL